MELTKIIQSPLQFHRNLFLSKTLHLYRHLIVQGLRNGLTKEDLKLMRVNKKLFSPPTYRTSLLIKIRFKFNLLKSISFLFGIEGQSKKRILRVLNQIEKSSTDIWNPSLIKSPERKYSNKSLSAARYKLSLYVIPSPYGFEWSNLKRLFLSLRNYLSLRFSHKIGHAFIVISENGRPIMASGMTGETNYQVIYDLLKKKIGLDFLVQQFRGRLEDHEFVLKDIAKHKKMNHIGSIHYDLTNEQFNLCQNHMKMFCEKGHYKSYGLILSPHKNQGASCTSYATSYLEVAGLMSKDLERAWKRKVSLPKYILKSTDKRIGLFRLIFKLIFSKKTTQQGSINSMDSMDIEFWDPDLMYQWIIKNVPQS